MIFYTSPYMSLIFAAMMLLAVLSATLRGRLATALSFVNIGLHIALIPVSLLEGARLAELALLFMLSLAAYTLSSYIKYRLSARKPAVNGTEEEGSDDI